ncbi:hypothetical protein EV383_5254 [Pseudonocardia sediminis]|uniref:Uncharacterized protein n=1 Tax=Pseudonocardia sediminis TaxID=1397368 RepID=A0A4Q7V2I5_PSEST|nr:hypothetical protein [Pseudonocardia sediminis]RZT88315.1 hypothetical protein EV383_5254 [Pseudonocardia sediminis]
MPMLDPLATFLMRIQAAGNDVAPVSALFRAGPDATDDQKAMAEQLARRAYEGGLIADTGTPDDGPARVAVTAAGEQFLVDCGL